MKAVINGIEIEGSLNEIESLLQKNKLRNEQNELQTNQQIKRIEQQNKHLNVLIDKNTHDKLTDKTRELEMSRKQFLTDAINNWIEKCNEKNDYELKSNNHLNNDFSFAHLNPRETIKRNAWTNEEDNMLKNIVKPRELIDWKKLVLVFHNRTLAAIKSRIFNLGLSDSSRCKPRKRKKVKHYRSSLSPDRRKIMTEILKWHVNKAKEYQQKYGWDYKVALKQAGRDYKMLQHDKNKIRDVLVDLNKSESQNMAQNVVLK